MAAADEVSRREGDAADGTETGSDAPAGTASGTSTVATAAASGVLLTLASAQFLMTLDSSVMNVSMATVASDLGTTITGIQTAITLYTLVMATLMITGGKVGSILGRRRAFAIGCVIYGIGSFVTGLSPTLPVLIIGWSFLEGVGAALIMPAVVALVAGNFAPAARPKAYGMVAAAAAIAVAAGPLIGGAATTYASWRLVFFGEVAMVAVILLLTRRLADAPAEGTHRLDLVGTALSVAGLGMSVYGVLRSSEWGWVAPKDPDVALFGVSPTFWLIAAGLAVVYGFLQWEHHLVTTGREPLVDPTILTNRQLSGGLILFAFQYLLQAGLFFVVPLYLSIVIGLTAMGTGLRLLPLSIALLVAATGIPKRWPSASPRRVVRIGIGLMTAGILALLSGIDLDADAGIVVVPLAIIGLGVGALASQLGSVTVSAVPTDEAGEVGGLQNTATNLGASLGTALAGSVLIAILTSSLLTGIAVQPELSDELKGAAEVELAAGVPFVSDDQAREALTDAGLDEATVDELVDENAQARIDGLDAALALLAVLAVVSMFFTRRIPTVQPADAGSPEAAAA